MADKGFNIEDSLSLYAAQLKITAFTKGKSQLPKGEVDKARQLASVCIHVERFIGLKRQKNTMLQGPVMLPLLKKDEEILS